MMKLIRQTELRDEDADRIESPFFASSKVEARLLARGDIYGLGKLLQASGSYSIHHPGPECRAYILGKIRSGEWLLVTSNPTEPLSREARLNAFGSKSARRILYFWSGLDALFVLIYIHGRMRLNKTPYFSDVSDLMAVLRDVDWFVMVLAFWGGGFACVDNI